MSAERGGEGGHPSIGVVNLILTLTLTLTHIILFFRQQSEKAKGGTSKPASVALLEAKHSALEFDAEEKPLSSYILVWSEGGVSIYD